MLDAGACNFPSKPLAPKPFCAVSGCRQGDSPIKRGRLPVSFFWAACSRPKERGLGHLLVVALARFWRLPGDWRGVGYVTDNDIRHPCRPMQVPVQHNTLRPRGANPLWASARGTFSIRRRARRLFLLLPAIWLLGIQVAICAPGQETPDAHRGTLIVGFSSQSFPHPS